MKQRGPNVWLGEMEKEKRTGGEKKGVPFPLPPVPPCHWVFFVYKVIAFTPVGDLGRFNHTISSLSQVNQIGQINRGSTGDVFTTLFLSLSLLSLSVPESWLSCSLLWLS